MVYAETAEQVLRQVDADRVLLVESGEDPRKGRVVWALSPNGGGPGPEGYEPFRDSYVGWVIRTGTQRIFPGASGPPRSQGVLPESWEREGERSFLVLPVKGSVGFRGALVCAHPQEKRFRKEHAEIAREITTVMQLGLSHVERIESLTKKADTDGLTGLSNRKAFLEQLAVDLARLDGRHPCGLVMLDIDHFKRVNDTYGHPFGDEVLRGVASVLGKGVRKGDTAGRYGGEEFVLYLHMANSERAREGAERFRRMIRQIRFAHKGKGDRRHRFLRRRVRPSSRGRSGGASETRRRGPLSLQAARPRPGDGLPGLKQRRGALTPPVGGDKLRSLQSISRRGAVWTHVGSSNPWSSPRCGKRSRNGERTRRSPYPSRSPGRNRTGISRPTRRCSSQSVSGENRGR